MKLFFQYSLFLSMIDLTTMINGELESADFVAM